MQKAICSLRFRTAPYAQTHHHLQHRPAAAMQIWVFIFSRKMLFCCSSMITRVRAFMFFQPLFSSAHIRYFLFVFPRFLTNVSYRTHICASGFPSFSHFTCAHPSFDRWRAEAQWKIYGDRYLAYNRIVPGMPFLVPLKGNLFI